MFLRKNAEMFLTIFISRLGFSPVLITNCVYIEKTLGIHLQYAKVKKEKI